MSVELSNDFKEAVRQQTDLVALISESILLQPRHGGREYVGLCPFHDDHNPSFHVYPDRQTFRCWVCNEGGDCFSFVIKHDRVEFREALEILARRVNIEIPTRNARRGANEVTAEPLEVLAWAERVFHQTLLESPIAETARQYLAQRGFTRETIERFCLGFHPNDWGWIQNQARGRYRGPQLAAACLVKPQEDGTRYSDYFTNRVLFPIHNERDQPVGFGGRVLPGESDRFGKYFNSPESGFFHKSRLLYALSHARQGLRETGTAVVTEGYTDCIAAHQAGLNNVVATLGTSLTIEQVTTLKRFARKVVLVYDGDAAGRLAAERAVTRFLAQDVDLRVLTLPGGQDPADYIEHHGVEALKDMIDAAPEAFDFVLHTLRERHGIDTVDGRKRLLDDVLQLLTGVPRLAKNIREDLLLQRTAETLGLTDEVIREQYREVRRAAKATPAATARGRLRVDVPEPGRDKADAERLLRGRFNRDDRLETAVLEILVAAPALTDLAADELQAEEFTNPVLRRIAEALFRLRNAGREITLSRLLAEFDDQPDTKSVVVLLEEQSQLKQVAAKLEGGDAAATAVPPLLRESIDRLKWRHEQQSHEQTALKLTQARRDDSAQVLESEEELLRQFTRYHQKRTTKRPTGT